MERHPTYFHIYQQAALLNSLDTENSKEVEENYG